MKQAPIETTRSLIYNTQMRIKTTQICLENKLSKLMNLPDSENMMMDIDYKNISKEIKKLSDELTSLYEVLLTLRLLLTNL